MFLEYGCNSHGDLVHISDSWRGRVRLTCPYCGVGLIAKKGSTLAHHFAHDGETCRESASRDEVQLPAYLKFNLSLPPSAWQNLQQFHKGHLTYRPHLQQLEELALIQFNKFAGRGGDYQFTQLGKVPFGEATLTAFATVQRELIEEKHERLIYQLERAKTKANKQLNLTDLTLYRAQLKRLLLTTLYFLEIKSDSEKFYKIGATTRQLSIRITEVESRLNQSFSAGVQIKVLRSLQGQGLIEHYFKHRFADNQKDLGSLTEYFTFENRRRVLSDLTRLGARELSELEENVLNDDIPDIAQQVYEELHTHSGRVRLGMRQAAEAGKHVGRPPEDDRHIIEKYPHVVEAIERGLSRRKAAAETAVSVPTIRKVHQALQALEKRQRRIERVLNPLPHELEFNLAIRLAYLDWPDNRNPFEYDSAAWRGYERGYDSCKNKSVFWIREEIEREFDELLEAAKKRKEEIAKRPNLSKPQRHIMNFIDAGKLLLVHSDVVETTAGLQVGKRRTLYALVRAGLVEPTKEWDLTIFRKPCEGYKPDPLLNVIYDDK